MNSESLRSNPSGSWLRRFVLWGAVSTIVVGGALFAWATKDSDWEETWRQRVRVEVPLGSTREYVLSWLRGNCEFLPTTFEADDLEKFRDALCGIEVVTLAGLRSSDVSSLVRTTVRRKDLAANADWDHMRLYLFFDDEEKVIGRFFLPFHELAQLERMVDVLEKQPSSPTNDNRTAASPIGDFWRKNDEK